MSCQCLCRGLQEGPNCHSSLIPLRGSWNKEMPNKAGLCLSLGFFFSFVSAVSVPFPALVKEILRAALQGGGRGRAQRGEVEQLLSCHPQTDWEGNAAVGTTTTDVETQHLCAARRAATTWRTHQQRDRIHASFSLHHTSPACGRACRRSHACTPAHTYTHLQAPPRIEIIRVKITQDYRLVSDFSAFFFLKDQKNTET